MTYEEAIERYEKLMYYHVRNCRVLRLHADDAMQHLRLELWLATSRYDPALGEPDPYFCSTIRQAAKRFRQLQPGRLIRVPVHLLGREEPPDVYGDQFGFALLHGKPPREYDDTPEVCRAVVGEEAWQFLLESQSGRPALALREGVSRQAIEARRETLIRRIRKAVRS